MMKKKVDITGKYVPPASETAGIPINSVLCSSPQSGGLEDVEYEDWVTKSSLQEMVE